MGVVLERLASADYFARFVSATLGIDALDLLLTRERPQQASSIELGFGPAGGLLFGFARTATELLADELDFPDPVEGTLRQGVEGAQSSLWTIASHPLGSIS